MPQAEVDRRAALAVELKLTKSNEKLAKTAAAVELKLAKANEKLAKTAAKDAARKNKRPRL